MLSLIHQVTEVLSYDFIVLALCGVVFLGLLTGLLSPMIVIKQRAYMGDLISHYIFPGVVAAYSISVWLSVPRVYTIFIGAGIAALFGSFVTEWIIKKLKVSSDAASVVSLSGFFALGSIILSKKPLPINLEAFLFGDILNLTWFDIYALLFILIVTAFVLVYWKRDWEAWLCDPEFAQLSGCPIKLLDAMFSVVITLVVLSSLFMAGSLMISALLALPAIIVRPKKVLSMLAICVSTALALLGFILAYIFDTPIGSTIVVLGFILVIIKTALTRYK